MGVLHVVSMSLPRFKINLSLSTTARPLVVLRKKPEDRGGLFPVWGYPWVQPKNTTTQTQAGDLFWRWVSLKNFTVQELKELREDRLLSYVLDQRDLRIEFAHLVAKRQLHSVMEGLRQQSKSSAQDDCGYGPPTQGPYTAAKKPRTTYAPAVDPKSQQPSGSQPGAGLPAPTSSVTRGQEELSHAFEYEAPSQPHSSGPSISGRDSVGSLPLGLDLEVRLPLRLASRGPLGPFAKTWTLLVVKRMSSMGALTAELRAALKELRRGLDALSHEVRGRMPSYEPQGYSYHSAYGYSTYTSSSHSVPSNPSYDSRGYQSVYHSQTPTPATPVVQRTQPRFEETQRIVIPLKTPHVERRVNGIRHRKWSNEAMLQLVAPYGAYQV
ncbi:LOW QUALITY PROTEIN: Hypothetical protein PHPALM_9717 [Phytophthora palmivora]|uniref:ATP-binding cassette (ABC) Superfamily n=1 Tax=Phytophthora palmivora TaxID=4796 RepID=A0A2P4Y6K3_9STRA|nr:LOW QUALITY PROTEIN: Hypothetical protein PHPALM_9717 [Phytophthora palmivora]